ncbi:glycosyl transferase family 1 [Vibrio toranzoniae]|uniref:Glycosyl transferase family 1 n=1 Tax=Vibrio toranzoniae TaxID=1194427 RepID=A0A120DHI7_9VIBR|nr:glycosyltransferase [Vibrio toranzoniae]KWU02526.1 glycosyl transferase family 1 [Vibrio toranzoniae]SBS37139.1 Putative glycosyltransferase EpsF [Vibrio toranzoniae]
MKKNKILHVITGLGDGGAEATLVRLCLADKKNEHIVISLMDSGKYGQYLKDNYVTVEVLNMPKGKVTLKGIIKLYKDIKRIAPDVVQTWMYHADLIGGVTARILGIKNINWGVHHSDLTPANSKKSTIFIAKICSYLSYFIPKNIIFCADSAARVHRKIGYSKRKIKIIYNGYDIKLFDRNNNYSASVKKEFHISEGTILLGMVSRFHPFKDHENLIKALGFLKRKGYSFKCILAGAGMLPGNKSLENWIRCSNVEDEVLLIGSRNDIPRIMNGIDIHLLSSSSEAFPNVLNEAMACGTPCVTTNVGDAAVIVGKTGWVTNAMDPINFSKLIEEAIDEMTLNSKLWEKRCLASRVRIIENYTVQLMKEKYVSVWLDELV